MGRAERAAEGPLPVVEYLNLAHFDPRLGTDGYYYLAQTVRDGMARRMFRQNLDFAVP